MADATTATCVRRRYWHAATAAAVRPVAGCARSHARRCRCWWRAPSPLPCLRRLMRARPSLSLHQPRACAAVADALRLLADQTHKLASPD